MTIKKYWLLFSFCCLLGLLNKGRAQNIDSLLTLQRIADPQEKAYVQFDKNYYNPGETIWFKAYLFTGTDPSLVSKNFYAELLDADGNIIDRKTAPVVKSSAASNFDLSAKLTKNTLYCRAYTTGMLNSDTSFLFVKPIRILIPAVAAAAPTKPKAGDATVSSGSRMIGVSPVSIIQFLPEGGDLVQGLHSNLAFKAIGPKGDPVEVSGTVKDNTGAKVLDFISLHDGMGVFGLEPEAGKTYTATWKDANGKTYTTPLPQAKPQGIVLQVIDQVNMKRFIIQRTDGTTESEKNLHIVAHMNQQLAYAANANLVEKKSVQGSLPTKDMPSGILQITVFDKDYKPLAERICFVNNHDYEFDADAFLPQKNLDKRGQNTLEVLISDTMPSNVSVAITDADLNQSEPLQDNIITHLLLTSDLKGKVNNPYYYFFSTSDSAAFHLDLVMLTHGWRRYNWPQVLAGQTKPQRLKENNYLSLNGQVAGTFAPGTLLTGILKTVDSVSSFITLPVSRTGKVSTDGLVFFDHAKLYFQFSDKKTQFDKSMMTVNNGLRPAYKIAALDSSGKTNPAPVDTAIIANNIKVNAYGQKLALQRVSKEHELQGVTVTAKAKTNIQKLEEKYVSGMFSGDAAASFDLTTDPFAVSSTSIFQYLQGKVAGLQINTTSTPPSLTWRGGSPALYLNEMQTDADQLSNTPVTDIAYIKVFRPGEAAILANSGGGVIAVYTKKGGDRTPDPNAKGLDYVQLPGYSPIKQFYIPDYANPTVATDLDDVRPTIYWNPFIFLDKTKKKLRFKFPNTDITHRFKLIMEGMNDAGKLVHVEKTIE